MILESLDSTQSANQPLSLKRPAAKYEDEPQTKRSKAEESALKEQSDLLFETQKALEEKLSKKQLTSICEANGIKTPKGLSALQEW